MGVRKEKLIDAILDSRGILTKVAEVADCSLKTVYNHRDRDDEVAKAITEAREVGDCLLLDKAESKLEQAVENGDFRTIKYVSLNSLEGSSLLPTNNPVATVTLTSNSTDIM